jgi:hypothetical protein
MTYSELYTTVTQYNTTIQRSMPTCGKVKRQILAWFWSNPYAKPNNDELTHNKNAILNPIS